MGLNGQVPGEYEAGGDVVIVDVAEEDADVVAAERGLDVDGDDVYRVLVRHACRPYACSQTRSCRQ